MGNVKNTSYQSLVPIKNINNSIFKTIIFKEKWLSSVEIKTMNEVEESQKQKEVTQISMTKQPNQKERREFTHYYYLLRALKV